MTTKVKDCTCRFTRVVEHGGDYCVICRTERAIDGSIIPPEPLHEVTIDGLEIRVLAQRDTMGGKHLTVLGAGLTSKWHQPGFSVLNKTWQLREIAELNLAESGWRVYFGDYSMSYADDLALMRDVALAVRYLSGRRPLDYSSPSPGDLERMADGLGLRLPRLMYRSGQTLSHSTFESLADFLAFTLRPKAAGPVNLRA